MDNRIFNVNGQGDTLLLDTLRLVFDQRGDKTTATGFLFDINYGLVLFWYSQDDHADLAKRSMPFPARMNADQCFPMVLQWLKSDQAKLVAQEGWWDKFSCHDGDNVPGWRVYCEGWGNVGEHSATICAIKPVSLWRGK